MDRIDKQILGALQDNARISNAELADKVNLSQSPCLRRLRKLEREGYIVGYRAELDPKKLGIHITALAFVKLAKSTARNARRFESAITHFPQVVECLVLAGSHDYMLKVMERSLESYDRFIKEELAAIDQIAGIESSIAMNDIRLGRGLI